MEKNEKNQRSSQRPNPMLNSPLTISALAHNPCDCIRFDEELQRFDYSSIQDMFDGRIHVFADRSPDDVNSIRVACSVHSKNLDIDPISRYDKTTKVLKVQFVTWLNTEKD